MFIAFLSFLVFAVHADVILWVSDPFNMGGVTMPGFVSACASSMWNGQPLVGTPLLCTARNVRSVLVGQRIVTPLASGSTSLVATDGADMLTGTGGPLLFDNINRVAAPTTSVDAVVWTGCDVNGNTDFNNNCQNFTTTAGNQNIARGSASSQGRAWIRNDVIVRGCNANGYRIYCYRNLTTETPTTKSPTKSPTTKSPTKSPTTKSPTKSPTTKSPTKSPTTKSPTKSPTTKSPTKSPTTVSPTKSPTTVSPTRSPTTVSPTRSPTTVSPTRSPTTVSPTKSPTTVSPTRSPTTVSPTRSPTTTSPTRSPTTESPTPLEVPTTRAPTRAPTTRAPTRVCQGFRRCYDCSNAGCKWVQTATTVGCVSPSTCNESAACIAQLTKCPESQDDTRSFCTGYCGQTGRIGCSCITGCVGSACCRDFNSSCPP